MSCCWLTSSQPMRDNQHHDWVEHQPSTRLSDVKHQEERSQDPCQDQVAHVRPMSGPLPAAAWTRMFLLRALIFSFHKMRLVVMWLSKLLRIKSPKKIIVIKLSRCRYCLQDEPCSSDLGTTNKLSRILCKHFSGVIERAVCVSMNRQVFNAFPFERTASQTQLVLVSRDNAQST